MATNPKIPVLDPQAITAAQAALAGTRRAPTRRASTRSASCCSATRCRTTIAASRVLEERFQQKTARAGRRVVAQPWEAWSRRSRSSWNRSPARSARSRICAPRPTRSSARDCESSSRDWRSVSARSPTRLASLEREFTERLGHESQALRDEVRRRNEDTRATIERMFSELSNVKTDRNLLAGLFVEIARCLNQDMTPKGVQGRKRRTLLSRLAGVRRRARVTTRGRWRTP